MINKYIKIYHNRNVKLALLISITTFVPCLIALLFGNANLKNALLCFSPFLIAALGVAVASLYTIRFKKMIKRQEQLYNITFEDTDAVNIYRTLFLSKDWLIFAGNCAIYKPHIKSIATVTTFARGKVYYAKIKTVDNKQYKVHCAPSAIKKIRQWKKL